MQKCCGFESYVIAEHINRGSTYSHVVYTSVPQSTCAGHIAYFITITVVEIFVVIKIVQIVRLSHDHTMCLSMTINMYAHRGCTQFVCEPERV
jgi:hypothetical protein